MKIPKLSIRGEMVMNGGNPTKTFDWADAVYDAVIMAGISFFATLAGAGVSGLEGLKLIGSALISAGATFFTILALKRNLIKEG